MSNDDRANEAEPRESTKRTSGGTSRVDRRRFLVTAVGSAGVGLLAGCSGDGGSSGSESTDSGSEPTDSGSSESESTDSGTVGSSDSSSSEPITLGASASLSGATSIEGRATRLGYQIWADQLNDTGSILTDGDETGLLGRPVEVTTYDDESTPSRAVNLYRRLITQDDVDLLAGPYSSAISNAVLPIIEQNQQAAVMPFVSDRSVFRERDISYAVMCIGHSGTYLKGAIDLGMERGAETVGVVYEDTAFPASIAETHSAYAEEQGLEVVHEASYPRDINDYTSVMNQLQSTDPDIVIGGGYTVDAISLGEAAQSLGFSPGIFAFMVGALSPDTYDSLGSAALGISGDLWWADWFDVPNNDALVTAIEDYSDQSPSEVDYHVAGGYGSALVMEQAVRNVGSLDQDAIAEELHALEMEVPWGNGLYAVDDQGVQTAHEPAMCQWQESDGGDELSQEAIWPPDVATADPIYPHPGWE
jgi:branched-chain amino acid transport system substrate-binding protein